MVIILAEFRRPHFFFNYLRLLGFSTPPVRGSKIKIGVSIVFSVYRTPEPNSNRGSKIENGVSIVFSVYRTPEPNSKIVGDFQ